MKSLNPSDAGIDSLIISSHGIILSFKSCLNPSDAGIDSLIGLEPEANKVEVNSLNPSDAGIDSLMLTGMLLTAVFYMS